ncbi:MAG: lipopolysaccharide heptosyltransferase I [Lentisphaeria bacterium]
MKILIVKPSSLGDVVHTLPAVALVRRTLPDAELAWLVNEEYAPLVRLCPAVDAVLPFRRRRWAQPAHWGELAAFARDLRRQRFDWILDFQGLLRSGLLAWCAGGSRRVGFRQAREGARWFYTETVSPPPPARHAVERNLALARQALGISAAAAGAAVFPVLARPADVRAQVEALLRAAGVAGRSPLLAVAPSARWPSKMWPGESFAALLDGLAERHPGGAALLVGTAAERPVGERILALRSRPAWPAVNLMGQTGVLELLELLRRCGILVANDSGPIHLAAAAGQPTVAFFGPTDPALTGPYGSRSAVLRGDCPEAPCFKADCRQAETRCWGHVTPTQALAAVDGLLAAIPPPP